MRKTKAQCREEIWKYWGSQTAPVDRLVGDVYDAGRELGRREGFAAALDVLRGKAEGMLDVGTPRDIGWTWGPLREFFERLEDDEQ